MRVTIALLLTLLCGGWIAYAGNENAGIWVGRQFRPEQCVKITPGRVTFKRKLCAIIYNIKQKDSIYTVEGLLRFDKKFIPDTVSHVDLEVLLIDEKWTCTKQLNLYAGVAGHQAKFFFRADNIPAQRYVRTYYVIHYRQQ